MHGGAGAWGRLRGVFFFHPLFLTQLTSAQVLFLAWWSQIMAPGPAGSASPGSLLELEWLPPFPDTLRKKL